MSLEDAITTLSLDIRQLSSQLNVWTLALTQRPISASSSTELSTAEQTNVAHADNRQDTETITAPKARVDVAPAIDVSKAVLANDDKADDTEDRAVDEPDVPLTFALLSDIQTILTGAEAMTANALAKALLKLPMPSKPWATIDEQEPITGTRLRRHLDGILKAEPIKRRGPRSYRLEQVKAALERHSNTQPAEASPQSSGETSPTEPDASSWMQDRLADLNKVLMHLVEVSQGEAAARIVEQYTNGRAVQDLDAPRLVRLIQQLRQLLPEDGLAAAPEDKTEADLRNELTGEAQQLVAKLSVSGHGPAALDVLQRFTANGTKVAELPASMLQSLVAELRTAAAAT
jgi:hypothetical protein